MIQFRPFTDKDFDTLISWVGSEKELIQFSGPDFKFPLTREQLVINLSEKNRHEYAITEDAPDKMIAYGEIYMTKENTAILGRILIGDPKKRGLGIGLQIVNHLLFISFEILGAANASLYVFDWNISAIKCYEKAGFVADQNKTNKLEYKGEIWNLLTMKIARRMT